MLDLMESFPKGMTVRIGQVVDPRRFDCRTNLFTDTETDRRNISAFNFTLNQTDRLVAKASGGYEQCDVCVHLLD